MRFIECGSTKYGCDGSTITCDREEGVSETISVDSADVTFREDEGRVTVLFREARCIVGFSQDEWDYLCGRIDSLPVVEEAPAVAEEETPVVSKKRRRS